MLDLFKYCQAPRGVCNRTKCSCAECKGVNKEKALKRMREDKAYCFEYGITAEQVEKIKTIVLAAEFLLYPWGMFDNYQVFIKNSAGQNILVGSIFERGKEGEKYTLETYKGLELLVQIEWERILADCGIKLEEKIISSDRRSIGKEK
jgi:hypothetical protein